MTRLYSGTTTQIIECHLVDKNKSKIRSPNFFHIFRRAIYRSPAFFKHEALSTTTILPKHVIANDSDLPCF